MIDGARVVPLQRVADERGTVMHMLSATDPHFLGFGEIYFTTVYGGVVKGWRTYYWRPWRTHLKPKKIS